MYIAFMDSLPPHILSTIIGYPAHLKLGIAGLPNKGMAIRTA